MRHGSWGVLLLVLAGTARAQDIPGVSPYIGPGSVGSNEPLFRYDDQDRWKHGWLHDMPYYGGYYNFRPYNYHHVFSQSATAAGWGMSPVMPYSQQFWHRYEDMTDLSRGNHTPVAPYERPVQEWDHYPRPLGGGAILLPGPEASIGAIPPASGTPSRMPAAGGPVLPDNTNSRGPQFPSARGTLYPQSDRQGL